MRKLTLFAALTVLAGFFSTVAAQAYDMPLTGRTFVREAAIGGKFEVASSKLALDRSSDPEVRKFAKMIVDDHSDVNAQLKSIVTAKNEWLRKNSDSKTASNKAFMIPDSLDDKHQTMLNQLKEASDAQFNERYILSQVAAHNEAVTLFTEYTASGKDTRLQRFAKDTLPTLLRHQVSIADINRNLGEM